MDYLTNYYKNLSEQLQEQVNALEAEVNSIESKKENDSASGVKGDYEGEMAKGELEYTIQNAQELIDQLKDEDELEAWVQSKITKAADYISAVKDYMIGRNKWKVLENF